MLLDDDDVQNGTLAEATAAAKWVVPVPGDGRREYTFDTGGVVARYLRVQRADDQYLSIAEVQAFAARPATLARYEGGAPLRAGEYDAEETLAVRFGYEGERRAGRAQRVRGGGSLGSCSRLARV